MEHDEPKKKTPWGLFIGLFLILGVIVLGALYTFNKRYYPVTHPTASSTQSY